MIIIKIAAVIGVGITGDIARGITGDITGDIVSTPAPAYVHSHKVLRNNLNKIDFHL